MVREGIKQKGTHCVDAQPQFHTVEGNADVGMILVCVCVYMWRREEICLTLLDRCKQATSASYLAAFLRARDPRSSLSTGVSFDEPAMVSLSMGGFISGERSTGRERERENEGGRNSFTVGRRCVGQFI